MGIVFVAVAVSVLFLLLVAGISRSSWRGLGVCLLSALALLPLLYVSPVLSLQAFLTLIATGICAGLRLGAKSILVSAVAAAMISFGLALLMPLAELQERQKLREAFPLASLDDRLAYERKRTDSNGPRDDRRSWSALLLNSNVEHRLAAFEDRTSSNNRRFFLSVLHNRVLDQFVMARGFGNTRMRRVHLEHVRLPDMSPIPLPEKAYVPDTGPPGPLADGNVFDPVRPSSDALLGLHSSGLEDFLEPERMGYIESRDRVAGFSSHRFTKMPDVSGRGSSESDWKVVRLELISLLKHETPLAYQSKNLPQMDALADAPTRSLDLFEREALDRLRTDEDRVIDEGPNQVRMVGSIRAAKDCLQCHEVRRGELLGAFTYELAPDKPTPAKKQPQGPPEPHA